MAGIRFTKAQRSVVTEWMLGVVANPDLSKADRKAAQEVLDKLETSELTKGMTKATGIGWRAAAEAMREVLGASLALPPAPTPLWMMKMSNRIRDLGLTVADCTTIAKTMNARPRRFGNLTYSFERVIWDADKLLAEAEMPTSTAPTARSTAPLSM